MPPKGATSCHDSMTASLRLSCDRCRAHKLKCSVLAGSNACQRCERARAPCVFGRRAPSKRRLSETGPVDQASSNPMPPCSPIQPAAVTPARLATPPPTSALAAAATSVSSSPGLSPDRQLEAPIDPKPALAAVPEMEPGSFGDPAAWESLNLGSHGVGPDISEYSNGSSSCDWLKYGWALDESTLFDLGQSDLAPWSQLATPTTAAASRPTDGILEAGSAQSSNALLPGQRLTGLVSDIQHQLRKLVEGPWHTDSACSLDDYPVGAILGLAQQFSAIAGPILSRTACLGGGLVEGGHGGHGGDDDETEYSKTSSATEDTPTMLLVMCGYMWLVRICTVVLGHFQKHLKNRSANRQHLGTPTSAHSSYGIINPIDGSSDGSTFITAAASFALRLGELPCADATLGVQQIYTAVRMLLGAMDDIEGHLGRGATVARAMAVALLLKSGTCGQDGSSAGLDKQATAVKELLREKMGL
ncbi:hypothetical protein C8A00DRAFT_18984 [Chaetomidium leptoderma]|uniref:Zn(2)-C6 fungal-type domain-containing protein n=1 Tax=Chaetomidium leptoderma TaxID=669021 RepID=A0AAN6ZSI3_9PEZI|nr:hypothetical protein C8A00DRAFT_18984 [Chaetomidium leptoderma]